MTRVPAPEFSRPAEVGDLNEGGRQLSIEADPEERARLARRFGLIGIDDLAARVSLAPEDDGRLVRLTGGFAADVIQTCVVTLEPIANHVEATIDRLYATTPSDGPAEPDSQKEENVDIDADEPPDSALDGIIDVGEAVAEELALALDPFPRKPGIPFTDYSVGPGGPESPTGTETPDSQAAAGPFAALAKLKGKLKQ